MPRRLPISGGPPASEPPSDGTGEGTWWQALTFFELAQGSGALRTALDVAFDAVRLPAELEGFFRHFPRRARILALADVRQAESQLVVAQTEHFCTLGKTLWLRTLPVATHGALARNLAEPPWPFLVFIGDDRRVFARWTPRRSGQHAPRGNEATSTGSEGPAAPDGAHSGVLLARNLARILATYAGLTPP